MDGCIEPKGRVIPMMNDLLPSLLEAFNQDANAIIFDQQLKESRDFLDANFDQSAMAKKFDLPPTKLSKLIKSYYGMSFAEFINRLRIHHFLSQRGDFDQFTLETYIYQSGFSNRSTFYAAFKKYVGVNPSFYLKEVDF